MPGLPITALFGADAVIVASDLTIDLAQLHAIAVLNNAHVLSSGAKLVPDSFTLADWDTSENLAALLQAAWHGYCVNNPKLNNSGVVVNDRKIDLSVFSEDESTRSFEPPNKLAFNSLGITNYWSDLASSGYNPAADSD